MLADKPLWSNPCPHLRLHKSDTSSYARNKNKGVTQITRADLTFWRESILLLALQDWQ